MGVNPGRPRRIVVDIDELVLAGFGRLNRDRVTSAFHRELTRLLQDDVSGLIATPVDHELSGLSVSTPLSSRGLGEAIARAVHSGLTQGEPE